MGTGTNSPPRAVKDRIVVAMSGGVDSSVAAALLHSEGHPLVGVFLRSGHSEEAPAGKGCCTVEDANDARAVAARLDIPFYILNLQEGFDRLIRHFVDEYVRGRTPSPCILCNQWLKFGRLLDYAGKIGARGVATGHYARVDREDGRPVLSRGRDAGKDQSYFLFSLTPEQLTRAIFPLGDLTKDEVREMAGRFELPVKEKAESQEICFVPEEGYPALIDRVAPGSLRPGTIEDAAGKTIGKHKGIGRYTVGQRKGTGVSGSEPRYVTRIDPETNRITLGPARDLLRTSLLASEISWLVDPPGEGTTLMASVQVRYRSRPQAATISPLGDGRVRVAFDSPVRAIAPGQAAVFYEGDRVLGGGWILEAAGDGEVTPSVPPG